MKKQDTGTLYRNQLMPFMLVSHCTYMSYDNNCSIIQCCLKLTLFLLSLNSYLIAKGVRLASFLEYAWALPRFRIPLLLSAGALLLNAIIYLPATFVDNHTVLYILPAVAILLEIASRYGLAMLGRLHHDNSRFASTNSSICIPAINVEHLIERTLQFVVIVFGEVVINASYLAHPGEFGAHTEYGRSALAIIIAFALVRLDLPPHIYCKKLLTRFLASLVLA